MPVLIDEVQLELTDSVTESGENRPSAEQLPLSAAEHELAQILDVLRQRQQRLQID
ncbi:hypothetical protein [Methylomonas sp. HYX-M1]|uniref:hypothetical protein n=1 Tax=Methylomonas sp. HYX-M1 TaxID=3139307 RepID=UPI00345BDCD3